MVGAGVPVHGGYLYRGGGTCIWGYLYMGVPVHGGGTCTWRSGPPDHQQQYASHLSDHLYLWK